MAEQTASPEADAQASGPLLSWLSVAGAVLCFGSFAVPMKWPSVVEARVHPLVYQSYKTAWTLATSLLVLPFEGFHFTWWGVASGVSWVPAGVAAVVAVQHVGVACGQAIWQVTIVATSLVWGFAVLRDERTYNWWGTALSLLFLTSGLVGMTLAFGSRRVPASPDLAEGEPAQPELAMGGRGVDRARSSPSLRHPLREHHAASPEETSGSTAIGIAAALFNGIWGGANLVPSHFSPLGGVHFVVSFAIGAAIVNTVLVCAFAVLAKLWWRTPLPAPHFRTMALPGLLSGTLWSAGNFCSLYTVSTIGQGIGYSLIQSSVIVSGLWGILYYREMTGRPVLYWVACCAVCAVGILGLAIEKKPN